MADSRLVSRLLIDRIAQAAQVVECDRAALSLSGRLSTSSEACELYVSTRALLELLRELHDAPLSDTEPPSTLRSGQETNSRERQPQLTAGPAAGPISSH